VEVNKVIEKKKEKLFGTLFAMSIDVSPYCIRVYVNGAAFFDANPYYIRSYGVSF
jgi:hypothetical protein